jgi:hypothetical protein
MTIEGAGRAASALFWASPFLRSLGLIPFALKLVEGSTVDVMDASLPTGSRFGSWRWATWLFSKRRAGFTPPLRHFAEPGDDRLNLPYQRLHFIFR